MRLTLMHPFVELEGVVGVRQVLVGHFFRFVLLFDLVKQPCSFFLVFGMSGLVTAGELCRILFFFFKGSLWFITRKKKGKIIAAGESYSVQESATSHNSNTCHTIYKLKRLCEEFFRLEGIASE